MNEEIKEILKEIKEYLNAKPFTIDMNSVITIKEFNLLLDYITNLQAIEQEHQKLNGELRKENKEYKSRIDKALYWTNRIIEIIKQQPSEDDTWILENLHSIKYLLQGSDRNE